jgi:hypothetical protein
MAEFGELDVESLVETLMEAAAAAPLEEAAGLLEQAFEALSHAMAALDDDA